jgi:hypothetical protein
VRRRDCSHVCKSRTLRKSRSGQAG